MTVGGDKPSKTNVILAYGMAIFLSAFLLFQVQLILGKYFLPWLGGTPAMWTTCMFFFQTLLLGGYLYAHVVARLLPLRSQGTAHVAVLLSALGIFVLSARAWHSPLLPGASWKPTGPNNPVLHLVVLLSVSSGLPYLLLSTTGPLLQSWFARTNPRLAPYRLYALSNFGSFVGLLSYPFVVEPWLTLKTQAWLWSAGFCLFLMVGAYCALLLTKNPPLEGEGPPDRPDSNNTAVSQSIGHAFFWLILAASGSLLFLATTNQICQNIAVVPLLWVTPLSIYLLSLVICFDRPNWYSRPVFQAGFIVSLIAAMFLLTGGGITNLRTQVVLYLLILFFGCMVCHGELARSKPPAEKLTLFYLMIAAGGALAGVFVVLVAPRAFSSFAEYPLGLWLTTLLMFVGVMRDRGSWLYAGRFGLAAIAVGTTLFPGCITLVMRGKLGANYLFLTGLVLSGVYMVTRKGKSGFDRAKRQAAPWFTGMAVLVLGSVFFTASRLQVQGSILAARNFYGLLTVQEINPSESEWAAYRLMHGRISQGFQFRSPLRSSLPTSYYGSASGVGQAVTILRTPPGESGKPRNLHFGMIGLGVGTLAAYARDGDHVRFYEINPDVIRIARDPRYFTYLKQCPAPLEIIPGDARLSMERELAGNTSPGFDLLVVDAFSGDAPPVHLLTRQAFEIYLQEIKADGIIAVNITNTYIDLRPVIVANAREINAKYRFVHSDGDNRITVYSDWMLLSKGTRLDDIGISPTPELGTSAGMLWTDDYSNLFKALR